MFKIAWTLVLVFDQLLPFLVNCSREGASLLPPSQCHLSTWSGSAVVEFHRPMDKTQWGGVSGLKLIEAEGCAPIGSFNLPSLGKLRWNNVDCGHTLWPTGPSLSQCCGPPHGGFFEVEDIGKFDHNRTATADFFEVFLACMDRL